MGTIADGAMLFMLRQWEFDKNYRCGNVKENKKEPIFSMLWGLSTQHLTQKYTITVMTRKFPTIAFFDEQMVIHEIA